MPRSQPKPIGDVVTRDEAVTELQRRIGTLAAKLVATTNPIEVVVLVTDLIKDVDYCSKLRDVILRQYLREGYTTHTLAQHCGQGVSKTTVSRACHG